MTAADVHKRGLGVWFEHDGTAGLCAWAPGAQTVTALLPGGDLLLLEAAGYGYWQAFTDRLKPGDDYMLMVDDRLRLPDPASVSQPAGVHGPSRAIDVAAFAWSDTAWRNHALEDYIFYELHVGAFSPEGTFEGVVRKIPHLKSLGVTAIEIMPVAAFPGRRNWGYDGVFPFAVQESYGGARGLQALVNACHAHGLAVVLDVVYNHVGPEGNVLASFGPYFTEKYKTPWGQAINLDDAGCDGVRRFIVENALMWFRDFHIDALRLDAVHALKDFSPHHILADLRRHTDVLARETWRTHYLIAEVDLNDTRFLLPTEQGGYAMDAQWNDEFHHALRVAAGQPRQGYYADFDGLPHLAKAYRDAYVYDGQYSPHRQKTFGVKATAHPGRQFVVFSQNHDQVGNRMLGERTSALASVALLKVLAAATILSPYLPLLFMGEEYGETNPFLYFVHHGDATLIENVRQGRRQEFAAFQAQGTAPDPQAEETFRQSCLQWELLHSDAHHRLFLFYQQLIGLRKQNRVLRQADRTRLHVHVACQGTVLHIHRWHAGEHVYSWLNFSPHRQTVATPPEAHLQKVLDSGEDRFGGTHAQPQAWINTALTLHPETVVVYTAEHV